MSSLINFDNSEYDAAQALLDLQTNIQDNHEYYDYNESVETAKLFMSCVLASNVPEEPILDVTSVGTASPMHAVAENSTKKSDVPITTIVLSDTSDSDIDEIFTRNNSKNEKSPHNATKYNTAKVVRKRKLDVNADGMVSIGKGNTLIPTRIFRSINWNSYTNATCTLLTAVLTRGDLRTHSVPGKSSPALPDKLAMKNLNPILVNDIIQTIAERCSVPKNVVRTFIKTKCADDSKLFHTQKNTKHKNNSIVNKENLPPESTSDEVIILDSILVK